MDWWCYTQHCSHFIQILHGLYMMVGIPLAYYCDLLFQRPRQDGVCCHYMCCYETLWHSSAMLVVMWTCAHAYHEICCIVWLPFRWPCTWPSWFSSGIWRHWDPGHTCKLLWFKWVCLVSLSPSTPEDCISVRGQMFEWSVYSNVSQHSNTFCLFRITIIICIVYIHLV